MSWLAHFNPVFLLPVWLKYVWCVRARYLGMITKIIDDQFMRRVSEYRVSFVHCGWSFLSPVIYKSKSAKIIAISGSVFQASSHFSSASTNAVHLSRLSSWVHWYMCFIVSGVTSQHSKRLDVVCPCHCRFAMVGRVLVMHFMMKCAMWKVVVSCSCLNNVKSILSQSTVSVSLRSSHCCCSRRVQILYAIYWAVSD